MQDVRDFFESLVYRSDDRLRFTQQSPIMPEVWIHYGTHPGEQVDLLMVPNWHHTPAELAKAIKLQLAADRESQIGAKLKRYRVAKDRTAPSVAFNQTVVVARLWFDELIRCVLPLSSWWRRSIAGIDDDEDGNDKDRLAGLLKSQQVFEQAVTAARTGAKFAESRNIAWLAHVAGLIAHISSETQRKKKAASVTTWAQHLQDIEEKEGKKIAGALWTILKSVGPVYREDDYPLYSVNLNRKTSASLYQSASAVKADAARRVFKVKGAGVSWAVVDSGVDARHMAFRERDEEGVAKSKPFAASRSVGRRRGAPEKKTRAKNQTRVTASFEFTHIRELLGTLPEDVDALDRDRFPPLKTKKNRDALKKYLESFDDRVLDWQCLERFIEIPHTEKEYRPPRHPHGTHVAGILGADWREGDEARPPGGPRLEGICPEIRLYDLRVLDDVGKGDEFAIMSAMQFIRNLNDRKDFVAIHGANLSFSIDHDVANYACGQTPVCVEAERLVNSGLVVVAAAGNSGRARYLTPSNAVDDGFRTVSITDPGNADAVITVGSTHRTDAHTYGVSYFSSRGPTGDGRLKPDLVAPGEKVRSSIPGNADDQLDGTSMAAPHVSGAAALIIARHPEFIGQPRRIKEILCDTATDLGRERYFQGAGLLDILRALQSI